MWDNRTPGATSLLSPVLVLVNIGFDPKLYLVLMLLPVELWQHPDLRPTAVG